MMHASKYPGTDLHSALTGHHWLRPHSRLQRDGSVSVRVDEGRKHEALRPQKPLSLPRDWDIGGSGILYLTPTRYTVTTRMILH